MPMIEVDFDTFKELTVRRQSEEVSVGDVIRNALGLDAKASPTPKNAAFWTSEGVDFAVGTKLRHRFRGGKVASAEIVKNGVSVGDMVFGGLSPAGVSIAGYQLNGWNFWEVEKAPDRWVAAHTLRP